MKLLLPKLLVWLILTSVLISAAVAGVTIELKCTPANCHYDADEPVNIDVFLSADSPTMLRAFRLVIQNSDVGQFVFESGADQQDLLFDKIFITNEPKSATEWKMRDAKNKGATVSSRTKIGSIRGKAVTTDVTVVSIVTDGNDQDTIGTFFQEKTGLFPVFHSFSSTALTINPLPSCGDNIIDDGEGCDDGAQNSNTDADACRTNCQNPRCGDFVTDSGEQCDDGDSVDTNVCKNDCTPNICGDNIVNAGVEQCDDGNKVNEDVCKNDCSENVCGDGVTLFSVEQCDDNNLVDGDGCSSGCIVECSGGKTNCAGQCIDLQIEENDCGSCGNACGSELVCEGGECVVNFVDTDGDAVNDKDEPSACVETAAYPSGALFFTSGSLAGCRRGDMNDDGRVTITDYSPWLVAYGATATGSSKGDVNNDQVVNIQDYSPWLIQYGFG